MTFRYYKLICCRKLVVTCVLRFSEKNHINIFTFLCTLYLIECMENLRYNYIFQHFIMTINCFNNGIRCIYGFPKYFSNR